MHRMCQALDLFNEKYAGVMPEDIAKEKNLLQVSDESAIAAIVDEVLNDPASAASIADIKAGKDKTIGLFIGCYRNCGSACLRKH